MTDATEIIILVHGFYKNRHDMLFLHEGLSDVGYEIMSVNLPVTFGTLEDCRNSLYLQLSEVIGKYEKINFVAHSMGGLIVRSYIDYFKPSNVSSVVLIGTPHKGSKLADILHFIPLFAKIFRPIDHLLTGREISHLVFDKNIAIGVIAGKTNNLLTGKFFLSDESDGRVEVASALSDDADDLIVLPYGHLEIHWQPETVAAVRTFLKYGKFTKRHE